MVSVHSVVKALLLGFALVASSSATAAEQAPLRIDVPAAARETVIVRPDNEDLTPPEPSKWERMERALGRGRLAARLLRRLYGSAR